MMRARSKLVAAAAALAWAGPAFAAPPCPGQYRSSEIEIAAQLDLSADGRFRYELTYGALDEAAAGRWRTDGDGAVLTSDPVTPPDFALAEDLLLAEPRLRVTLELPRGISPQYFTVALRLTDGTVNGQQFPEGDLDVASDPTNPPVALRIDLPVFGLSSQSFALAPAAGHALRVRFLPNDLGKVAFADTPLERNGGALLLKRHDRSITLRRVGPCEG